MINVGIVGFGLSGRYLQAPFFQVLPEFHLKTIVSSQSVPSVFFPDTKRVSNFEELLSDTDLHLISICSPSSTHFEYAKAALQAGKHVLVEKPFTATIEEAVELFDLAAKSNLGLFVFHNRRFDSDFLTLKKVLASGILGEIHTYEANFDRFKPILNPKKWKEIEAPGNGILYDLGSHLLDQVISLFGRPQAVSGEVFTQRKDSQIDDAFHVNLIYPEMRVRLNSSLMMKSPRPRYSVHGILGSFVKYGIDVQEDHLVTDIWPNRPGFGKENEEFKAEINYMHHGMDLKSGIETERGSWISLFQNIADVLLRGEKAFFTPDDILCQLQIINGIKKSR
jgi:scyllo-inositol 2-dehydrogenase (NADP+)